MRPFILERYFAKHEFTAKYLLSSSDCDGFPMSYILEQANAEELDMWNNLTLGYTEGPGSIFLRESICRYYKGAEPQNVMVASPGELSFMLMNLLMEGAGRAHAVVVSPAYQSLYEVLMSLGCELSYWKPSIQAGEWQYDTSHLKELVRSNTRLIIINFPHNPTGAYLTAAQLQEVVDIARSCGAYLYSDEMYRDLIVDSSMEPLPSAFDLYDKAVSLWGTAKSFGLAGLRTGWFVSKDVELLNRIMQFKEYLSICNSAPAEVLTSIALNHSEKFIGPNVCKIKGNIDYFKQVLKEGKLPFFGNFIAPKAGSIAFVPINLQEAGSVLGGRSVETSLEFSDALVEQTGIMTIPAEMFEYDGAYLRIGFGRGCFKEVIDKLM